MAEFRKLETNPELKGSTGRNRLTEHLHKVPYEIRVHKTPLSNLEFTVNTGFQVVKDPTGNRSTNMYLRLGSEVVNRVFTKKERKLQIPDVKPANKSTHRTQTNPQAGLNYLSQISSRKLVKGPSITIVRLLVNKEYEAITLPFIPRSADVTVTSNFEPIVSLGRNNPKDIHFSNSDDTLKLELDWFFPSDQSIELKKLRIQPAVYREWVYHASVWVNSLPKANGWKGTPSPIRLIWGDGQRKPFNNDIWVVKEVEGNLSQLHKPNSLFPQRIIQRVTLQKISKTNLNWTELMQY